MKENYFLNVDIRIKQNCMYTNIVRKESRYKATGNHSRNFLVSMIDMFAQIDKDLDYKRHMVLEVEEVELELNIHFSHIYYHL